MDISNLLNENFNSLVVFFPVMRLTSVYELQYGNIGPISELKKKYTILNELSTLLTNNFVNNEVIKDPIVAVSDSHPAKLLDEIEFITFFSSSSEEARGEEEILGQRHIIGLFEKDDKIYLNLDGHAVGAPLHLLHGTKFRYFPHNYFTWNNEAIKNFEDFFKDILKSNLYKALILCLAEVQDKEAKKDRKRILVSIKIFNEAMIPPNIPSFHRFSKNYIILIVAAFEALLNLSHDNIEKTFQHSVMLLAGNRSTMLKRWCKEFYNYRSKLAHGDIEWYHKEELFNIGGNKRLPYRYIASRLFVHCLQTKLFLMGLFPEYKRDEFIIEAHA